MTLATGRSDLLPSVPLVDRKRVDKTFILPFVFIFVFQFSILLFTSRSSYHLYLFTYFWEVLFIIKQYFFINAIHPAFVISDQWNGSDLSGVSITGTSVSGNLIWYQSVHITVVQSESLFTCDNRHCPKSSASNGTFSNKI